MSLLLLFYAQLFINIEFYYEEKYKLVGASILAAVVNIVLNYFGIKWFGFVAAGYTTLISYILFAVCNYIAMVKVCKDKGIIGDIYNYKVLLLLLSVFVLIGFGFTALYPYRWMRVGVIVVGVTVIIIQRDKVISLTKNAISTIKDKK